MTIKVQVDGFLTSRTVAALFGSPIYRECYYSR